MNALQNCSEKQEFDKLLDFVLQNWKNKVRNLENILLVIELKVNIKSELEVRFQSECLHPVLQVKALTIYSKITQTEDLKLCKEALVLLRIIIED